MMDCFAGPWFHEGSTSAALTGNVNIKNKVKMMIVLDINHLPAFLVIILPPNLFGTFKA
jgi:hypothetical protein